MDELQLIDYTQQLNDMQITLDRLSSTMDMAYTLMLFTFQLILVSAVCIFLYKSIKQLF